MVAIPNGAKLISTTVNAKSGTTIKKLTLPKYGKKAMATIVEYGANNPLKKRGVDSFVKITGTDHGQTLIDRALFSGDKMILNGAAKAENFKSVGSFTSRFKEMVDLLKKYPKLTADLIPNASSTSFWGEAIKQFQKQLP